MEMLNKFRANKEKESTQTNNAPSTDAINTNETRLDIVL